MRTALGASANGRGMAINKILIGALAVAATIATTSAVSFQDIAELTGTEINTNSRWLARIIAVPKGATFQKAEDRLEVGSGAISHTLGVRTAGAVKMLASNNRFDHQPIQIKRAMKGDRVFAPTEPQFNVEQASWALLKADRVVPGRADTGAKTNLTNPPRHLIALAQTFRPTKSATDEPSNQQPTMMASLDDDSLANAVRARLERGHLQQARAAARVMARVVERVKHSEARGLDYASTASAYAPQERDIASAFAAVLQPPTTKIRLRPGDHKWAAKSLPSYARSTAERRCLASGIYFEARSEPISGQQAVAQVILNRVKNPAYPNSICGVVYQNKWKRNACQFSFACDGIRDRVNSQRHWKMAQKIANDAIEGRFWLRSVGSASHYHADYVWPRWRRKMKKMVKIGRHIFYRTYGGGWS